MRPKLPVRTLPVQLLGEFACTVVPIVAGCRRWAAAP